MIEWTKTINMNIKVVTTKTNESVKINKIKINKKQIITE